MGPESDALLESLKYETVEELNQELASVDLGLTEDEEYELISLIDSTYSSTS